MASESVSVRVSQEMRVASTAQVEAARDEALIAGVQSMLRVARVMQDGSLHSVARARVWNELQGPAEEEKEAEGHKTVKKGGRR